jgi:hypothetical protein
MSSYAVRRQADSPPRTLGTLNIVFGILALCWGLCSDSAMMGFPALMQAIGRQSTDTQRMLDERQKRQIESLKEQEATAKTQAEKDRLRKELADQRVRRVVVTTPQNEMLTKMKVDDPRYFAHYGTVLVTGLILNTAMIVAGVGLLRLRPWGRTVSLWVAALHLVRLVAVTASMVIIVGPIWARMSEAMSTTTTAAVMDPESLRDMNAMNRSFSLAMQVGLFVLGSIYPIVTLWLLNTRSSLAALGLAKPDEPLPADEWPELAPGPMAAKAGPSKFAGVLPDPRGPRRIGIFAIVIALVLMATCNQWSIFYAALLPAFSRMGQAMERSATKAIQEERRHDLEEARAKVEAAKTEAERSEAQAGLQALEASPMPPTPPISWFYDSLNDRRVRPYIWLDAMTGLMLNVAMFVGAIGLVQLREWGRKTTFWVAAAKVLRIALATVLGVGVVMPALGRVAADGLGKFLSQMPRGPGGGPSPAQLRSVMTIVCTASLVVFELLALIWPLIVLWVLSRPKAQAACLATGRGRSRLP